MKPIRNAILKHPNWTIAIILGLGLLWILASRVTNPNADTIGIAQPHIGFAAPDITLSDQAGNSIQLTELRGQPVIINFWASWCPPCRAEMSAIEAVHQTYQGQGLVVLGVNAANQDNFAQAQEFVSEMDLSFQILYDTTGNVQDLYEVSALPTTFFINRAGIIQEVVIGGPIAEALLNIHAEEILKEQP